MKKRKKVNLSCQRYSIRLSPDNAIGVTLQAVLPEKPTVMLIAEGIVEVEAVLHLRTLISLGMNCLLLFVLLCQLTLLWIFNNTNLNILPFSHLGKPLIMRYSIHFLNYIRIFLSTLWIQNLHILVLSIYTTTYLVKCHKWGLEEGKMYMYADFTTI